MASSCLQTVFVAVCEKELFAWANACVDNGADGVQNIAAWKIKGRRDFAKACTFLMSLFLHKLVTGKPQLNSRQRQVPEKQCLRLYVHSENLRNGQQPYASPRLQQRYRPSEDSFSSAFRRQDNGVSVQKEQSFLCRQSHLMEVQG